MSKGDGNVFLDESSNTMASVDYFPIVPMRHPAHSVPGTPPSVPALSVWGIAILAILLAAIAMLFVARTHGRTAA